MTRTLVFLSGLTLVLTVACAEPGAAPAAVDGWREYPLRDGVISLQPAKWRTDIIDIAVPVGDGLEYKLTMMKGETLVYHPAMARSPSMAGSSPTTARLKSS